MTQPPLGITGVSPATGPMVYGIAYAPVAESKRLKSMGFAGMSDVCAV